jgi:hypothetical protein
MSAPPDVADLVSEHVSLFSGAVALTELSAEYQDIRFKLTFLLLGADEEVV